MSGERLERGLRERGPRELGASIPPLPSDVDEARARLRAIDRHRGLRALAGGVLATGATLATAAAAVVLAMTLTTHPTPSPGLLPGATGSPTGTTAQSPGGSAACAPGDLSAVAEPWGAAAGSRGTLVTVTNTSDLACSVSGSPGARLASGGTVLAETPAHPSTSKGLRLSSGASAVTSITWSNWCESDPAQPIGMTLVLPGGDLTVTPDPASPDVLVPPCMGSNDRNVLSTIDFQLPSAP